MLGELAGEKMDISDSVIETHAECVSISAHGPFDGLISMTHNMQFSRFLFIAFGFSRK
jgi:hypothetical protein